MPGYGPGTPQFDNLDPQMQAIALRIMQESGGRVWVGSGWRSIEQQADLYNRWISGNYNVPSVAKPGRSKHNHGRAIDFSGDLRLAQALGRKYGLIFPVKGEAWHGELAGAGTHQDMSMGGVQYDLNYMGGQPISPEDVLANRMHSIMRIMGTGDTANVLEPDLMDDFGMTDPEAFMQAGGTPWELASAAFPGMMQDGSGLADFTGEGGDRYPVFTLNADKQTAKAAYQVADARNFGVYAKSLFKQFGWDPSEFPALVDLWNRESGDPKAGSSKVTWNPLAQNPTSTAFGIAQFLNGTWAGTGIQKTTNPLRQILAGLIYIHNRFGTPSQALAFHSANNWY